MTQTRHKIGAKLSCKAETFSPQFLPFINECRSPRSLQEPTTYPTPTRGE